MTATTIRRVPAPRHRMPFWRTAVALGLCAALLLAGLATNRTTSAAEGNWLRLSPAVQTVAEGGSFTVTIDQHALVPSAGTSASISFDPALLQVQSVVFGDAFVDAFLHQGATAGFITTANGTGLLQGVSAAFQAPDTVAAGDTVFATVTFKAVGCGLAQLGMPTGANDAHILDGSDANYGLVALPITVAGATVALCNTLSVQPATSAVPTGGTFTARVVQHAGVATSGALATITFDPTILQIQAVTYSAAYADSQQAGATEPAIAAANLSGALVGVAATFATPTSIPAGDVDFVAVLFQAVGCGTSTLGLPQADGQVKLLDGTDGATYGSPLQVATVGAEVTTCVAATPTPTATASGSASPSATPTATPPPGNRLIVDPAKRTPNLDDTFAVTVKAHSEVPLSGVTSTLFFDPTVLQVVSASAAPAWANAKVAQLANDLWIAPANTSGVIRVDGAFQKSASTGTGESVPAGDTDFVTFQFKVIGCGVSPLWVPADATRNKLLDGRDAGYLKSLAIQTVGASVQACGSQPMTGPSIPSGNSNRLEPYATKVVKNGGFTVRIVQKSSLATSGNATSIIFDPAALQVVKVSYSTAFANAPSTQGTSAKAIAAANTSGILLQVAAFFIRPGNVPAGENDFASVEFKVRTGYCGLTPLLVPNAVSYNSLLDGRDSDTSYGSALAISTIKGLVTVCDPHASPTPRPTRTPAPTTAPTAPPYVPPPTQAPVITPPSTQESQAAPSVDVPSTEPSAAPRPSPSRAPIVLAAAVRPASSPGTGTVMRNAAMVGLGVAGVVLGLAIVLGLAAFLLIAVLVPVVLVRMRTNRRR